MTVDIRLMGTPEDVEKIAEQLKVFGVNIDDSRQYRNRGSDHRVRVYGNIDTHDVDEASFSAHIKHSGVDGKWKWFARANAGVTDHSEMTIEQVSGSSCTVGEAIDDSIVEAINSNSRQFAWEILAEENKKGDDDET